MNALKLLPNTPFELAIPERIMFYDLKQAIDFINKNNGKKRIFYSLYNVQHPVIDKIWFDFDSDKSLDNVKRFNEHFKNYKRAIIFSGGGFHAYLFTSNCDKVVDAKAVLMAVHREIIKDLGFTCSIDNKHVDVDGHIIGNIRQVTTLPGTYNTKRRRWAISLKEKELELSIEEIKELAREQRNFIHIIGEELFDLEKYKDIRAEVSFNSINIPRLENYDNFSDDEMFNLFPPCMQNVLLNRGTAGNWTGRWQFTIWAKELGLTEKETDKLAKEYFGRAVRTDNLKNNYVQWRKVKALELAYSKDPILPSCEKQSLCGMCPGKCKFYLTK